MILKLNLANTKTHYNQVRRQAVDRVEMSAVHVTDTVRVQDVHRFTDQ